MPRGNGGVIGPVNASVSGVWSLIEAQLRRSGNTWPNIYGSTLDETATGTDSIVGGLLYDRIIEELSTGSDSILSEIILAGGDPYFNLTTLLLSTTASNTQQNNTFLDSSGINTITRVPSAGPNAPTQGTFSPFSQTGWSNYFDGTGDFINTPATGQFAPAGDFTIRFWFYLTSLAATNHLIGNYSAAATTDWLLEVTTGGVLQVFTNGSTLRLSQSGITANQWYYVTVTRTGTTITGQLFGSNFNTTATYTQSGTFGTATKSIYLGMRTGSTNPLTGYLVDVSLVDGSAIQTVPTAPLTAVTGTKLLTCQSNRFVDNSSSPNTLTIGGNTTIANLSPYNFTTPWSALTVGGSGYFDGTGDYLSTTVTVSDFYTALGDFTFEGWVYPLSFLGPQYSSPLFGFTSDDLMLRAMPTSATSTTLNIYGINSAGGAAFGSAGTSGGTIRLNEWAWVVFTRESGVLNLWVNGTRVVNNSTYTSIQLRQTATSLRIGSAFAGTPAPLWNGYLSGIKWTSGAALYSGAAISMPTAPPTTTVSSGTNRLLLNFTNPGIYDATAKSVLETVGSAQVSNTTSQWPSTSMLFNGTTDYLQVNTASDLYNLSSGNWTIEAWVYRTGANQMSPISYLNGSGTTLNGWAIEVNRNTAGTLYWASYNASTGPSGSAISAANLVPPNVWTYIAVTCVGTTITLYVNGASVVTGTRGTIGNDSSCRLRIGGMNYTTVRYWQGYIQDPRITKGYARTIATPTAAFPVQGSLGAPASVEYLIIAGGGGGAGSGNLTTAGGGGSRGYRSSVAGESSGGGASAETTIAVYAGLTVTVTVGSGGAAGSDYYNGGGATTGLASSIAVASLTTISTVGGGIGAAGFAGAGNGGSGGGAMQASGAGTGTANQGYAGGLGNGAWNASGRGGGGGGAGGIGGTYTTGAGGTGGAGVTSSITGTAVTRAGGGGGSGGTGTGGTGTAGGGNGAVQTSPNGSPALPNTGSGGGASSAAAGGAAGGTGGQGGSGIVVIRYSSLYAAAAATTGSPTITVAGGYRVYTWTGNGSITF